MQRTKFVDKDKCVGCDACIVACKLEHNLPPHPADPPLGNPQGPNLIRIYQIGPELHDDEIYQYYLPISCMHCDDAPCIRACPRSAIVHDNQGKFMVVMNRIDQSRYS